jgi:hypothetical protein
MSVRLFAALTWMLLACALPAHAQEYPRWFLRPGDLGRPDAAAGYALPSMYLDTTGGPAFRNAAENLVRFREAVFSGSEAFWTAEFGTMVVGSSVAEEYDTAAVESEVQRLKVLHQYKTPKITLVLAGSGAPAADAERVLLNLRAVPRPTWIERPPASTTHLYAVGMSAEYFYESSSWLMAEFTARRELARSVTSILRSLQRVSTVGQEVRDETLRCRLRNIAVIERWKDPIKRIHYVLVRMLKPTGME